MKILIVSLLLLPAISLAQVFKQNSDGSYSIQKKAFLVSEAVSDYARLKSYNLALAPEFIDGEIQVHGSAPVTDLDKYISIVLFETGHSLLQRPDTSLIKVISNRDNRYISLAVYKEGDKIPDTYNYIQYSYKMKYVKGEELSRNLRPFLTRYGRLIDDEPSKTVHISDMGSNIKRFLKIIESIDTAEFLKNQKEVEEINAKNEQVLKKSKGFFEIVDKNQVIFLIIFFLIGGIIGFGSRSYLMKRVEGGW